MERKIYSMDAFTNQFTEDNRNGLVGFLKERVEYLDTALEHLTEMCFRDRYVGVQAAERHGY